MFAIRDIPLERIRDKRILVLIDPNIEKAAPTLGSLIGKSARLVVATHAKGPAGRTTERLGLDFAKGLSHVLGRPVHKMDSAVRPDVVRAVFDMKPGEIVLLENLAIYPEDANNEVAFARQLASLCDVFVNDAFDVAHRALASNVGITRWVPISIAGPAFARRVKDLQDFSANPTRPFLAVVGGAQAEHKLPLLRALLPHLDRLFIGGALAFSFLKAAGRETGKAPIEPGCLRFICDFIEEAKTRTEIVLPEDFMVRDGNTISCSSELRPDDQPVDIGTHTMAQLSNLMKGAYSILWIDSLGVHGREQRSASDWEVMQQLYSGIPRHWQSALLAGDELVYSLAKSDDPSHFEHLSLFGDAAIHLLAGWPLPAIDALHVDALVPKCGSRKPVLIPVDSSDHALEGARWLCRHVDVENAEIHLLYVHATNSPARDLWRDPNDIARADADARMTGRPVFARIVRELARYGLTPHHQVVRQGDPAEQILKYAAQIHAELILMGSHGRSKVLRLMQGNVSETVLDKARCPVLIARIVGDRAGEVFDD
jgi:phosphoglycerate kinase